MVEREAHPPTLAKYRIIRRLLINEKPSFASIGYSHQQLSRVPRGMANRHSQFHCPKSKL